MKVLLDHDLPKRLRLLLSGHLALTARQMGWEALSNGRLIAAATAAGFNVILTGDRRMADEQNDNRREIALVLLNSVLFDRIALHIGSVQEAVDRAQPGSFETVEIPLPPKPRPVKRSV